jgi:hypothetical protein
LRTKTLVRKVFFAEMEIHKIDSWSRLVEHVLHVVAALQLGRAAVDLALAPDDASLADAPDAQPAHVFGVRDARDRHFLPVRLVAAKVAPF